MTNILETICAQKLLQIEKCKSLKPETELLAEVRDAKPVRGFYKALKENSENGYGLIGEIKKASPSKGLIRENFNPEALAIAYEIGRAHV